MRGLTKKLQGIPKFDGYLSCLGWFERQSDAGFIDGRIAEEIADKYVDIGRCPQSRHFDTALVILQFVAFFFVKRLAQLLHVALNTACEILQAVKNTREHVQCAP